MANENNADSFGTNHDTWSWHEGLTGQQGDGDQRRYLIVVFDPVEHDWNDLEDITHQAIQEWKSASYEAQEITETL